MKSKLLALGFSALVGSAFAAPIPAIPVGPGIIKFNNLEQIAVAGTTCFQAYCAGHTDEINWGVYVVSSIEPAVKFGNSLISSGGAYFNNDTDGNLTGQGQLVGMFYGARALTAAEKVGTADPFPAKLGFLDLYYRDAATYGTDPVKLSDYIGGHGGLRTAFDKAGDFTTGNLLVHLEFASGIDPLDPDVFISGTIVPAAGGFSTGLANSFANVVLGSGGLLEGLFNSDQFTTAFGTRDFKFRNNYIPFSPWDDIDLVAGRVLLGAQSEDPANFVAVPEPGSIALVGLGLLGVAAIRRRRNV